MDVGSDGATGKRGVATGDGEKDEFESTNRVADKICGLESVAVTVDGEICAAVARSEGLRLQLWRMVAHL
ncbi:hypothetical protein VZT92_000897 [Zoarces viviparus]|uniref:Uncharacterized protein n=1 Tax=Zoarces viviparus TaxID=48416 RepID=A0AAW1G8F9_ZOAVI